MKDSDGNPIILSHTPRPGPIGDPRSTLDGSSKAPRRSEEALRTGGGPDRSTLHVPGQPAASPEAELSPMEALNCSFLLLCQQYHQMGQQLKNISDVIGVLTRQAKNRGEVIR